MESDISPKIIAALISADATGMIRIPNGSANEIEEMTLQLAVLEKMGFLSRTPGTGFYRPFHLTEKGVRLKKVLIKAEKASGLPG